MYSHDSPTRVTNFKLNELKVTFPWLLAPAVSAAVPRDNVCESVLSPISMG
jgi:hypothetical protein